MINLNRRKIIATTVFLMVIVYIVVNVASICIYGTKDEKCKADVAIVLGAAAYEGEVSQVYRERINHGITLYKEGYVEKIIVTGGIGEGNDKSDAYYAKEYAVQMGVSADDVLTENTSTITEENLENAKLIMEQNGYDTAIIVSDPLHMKRAMLLAKDAGIKGYSSPTPTTRYQSLKTKIPFVARETFFYVGYKWYRIFD
ncbi:MAG: YdcF family protein [Lachnospiraceae bacterium]|nr:YdcF family protein [Lachnospiraceae bacterium]